MKRILLALLLPCCLIAVADFSKSQPRIDDWRVWSRKDGCQFASFKITGGDPGDYWLMWYSPEFIVPNMPLPITRLTNYGTETFYVNVPLLTNFNASFFYLQTAPPRDCP